jgi:branched-chain amino acid transport system substrate-binding protein
VGAFYAVVLLVVTPVSVFGMLVSAQALTVTLFGGVGTVWGPVIGAAILIPLSEILHAELGHVIPGIQGVVFGLAIIVLMLVAPEGIFWHARDFVGRRWPALVAGPAPRPARPAGTAGLETAPERPGRSAAAPARGPRGEVILEVRGLSRAFGGLKAVANVGFTVHRGVILGIIGPNGAGKTTVFNLLNGFLVPDAGEIVLDGRNMVGRRPHELCRAGVAQETDLVAATGAYLSSFTLAVTEVTERAELPVLTLSYSDQITERGFKYVFQTSATSGSQATQALPVLVKIAESATGQRPKTVAIITDNTAASISSVKPMKERLLKELGIQLVVDETFTPPLADATPLVQKVRATRPDLLFFLPTVISDAKRVLEKMNEFGLGKGRIPTVSFGIAIAEPDMLRTMTPDLLQGAMAAVGNWGSKGHEALIAELKRKYNEPWMTQNAISTYGDMWIIKSALERARKADRRAVAEALRTMDDGPSKYYPGGQMKFDDKGRRVGAGLAIIQWQNGVPVTVYPPEMAVAAPIWPKK